MSISLYDQKGRPFIEAPGAISYYKDINGTLIRVPSMTSSSFEDIMRYLNLCVNIPKDVMTHEEIVEYIQEIWDEGERKTRLVLEMLQRRASELKDVSIMSLVYAKVYEILSKLRVPIFTRKQLSNVPNISNKILDEIDQVLLS